MHELHGHPQLIDHHFQMPNQSNGYIRTNSSPFGLKILPSQPGPYRIDFGANVVTDLTQDDEPHLIAITERNGRNKRGGDCSGRSEIEDEGDEEHANMQNYGGRVKHFKAYQEYVEKQNHPPANAERLKQVKSVGPAGSRGLSTVPRLASSTMIPAGSRGSLGGVRAVVLLVLAIAFEAESGALESSQLEQMQAASVVQKNGAEAQAELSLCKLQMNHAQQDIKRAQDVMRTLEVQRDDAERAATRARAAARKLHIEKMSILAREEGREEGYEMGFRHGQTIATAKRDLSRGLPGAPPQPSQPQTRRRRESLDPVRSIQLRLPEGPAVQSLCPSPRNHPPPRRPASAMSVSSSRLVSAPPVVTQQASRSRTTSIDGSHRASSRAGHSSAVIETGNSTATPQQNIRNSSVSRHSLAFPSGAAVAAAAPNNIHQTRRRSASAFELESGLGSGPPPMPTDTMMPRTIYMYPPPPVISVMPRHIPMPPLPAGAMPMPSPVRASAQPLAPLLSQPQSQFEVERPEHRDTRSPSPISTSLGTLHLTSFPAVSAGPGSVAGGRADESAMARERDPVPAMGLGLGWEREQRELSVILEDAAGSPGGSQLGNSWEAHPPRQRTPWGDGSSTYSDPRGIEEWRRGTDEEARLSFLLLSYALTNH
ncbi:hypothetical protein B0H10DRAFT_1960697 [Mycena sp. CBHHK59/15]|nr:hypothetical protein B0H10DRAFT_1960697 [Mycena sp. CBHHK59/15]